MTGGQHPDTPDRPVCVRFDTIADGLVLRWYRTMRDAELQRPLCTASRRGVLIGNGVYLHEIPQQVLAEARHAYEALSLGHDDDAAVFATHEKNSLLAGRLEPVERKG